MAITSQPMPQGNAQPASTPAQTATPVATPVANAAAIVGEPSAAPGATAEVATEGGTKPRRGRKPGAGRGPTKKIEYPGLYGEATEGQDAPKILLTEIPADYNPKLHKPLKKDDFVDEETFLIARAKRFRELADQLEKRAETLKTLGTGEQRKAASKLLKMQEGIAALMESLKAQGVNVDALMASANVSTDAAE